MMIYSVMRSPGKLKRKTFLAGIVLLTCSLAGRADVRTVSDFEQLEPVVSQFPGNIQTLTGQEMAFTFKDKRIQQQRFRKTPRRDVWQNFLFFSPAVYCPASGEVFFNAVIYENTDSRAALLIKSPFAINADEKLGREVIRLSDRYALDVVLTGTVQGANKNPDKSYSLVLSNPTACLISEGKVLLTQPVRLVRTEELPHPGAGLATGQKHTETSVLEIEAEEAGSLQWYADWERDLPGWYGKEITRGASGKGIAVVHAKNTGAGFDYPLPQTLAPGSYQVLILPYYIRARWRDNIIELTLGGKSTQSFWYWGGEWMSSPVLQITQPASVLTIMAIQVGGGGVNASPEMRELVIMLDKIKIVKIEEKGP